MCFLGMFLFVFWSKMPDLLGMLVDAPAERVLAVPLRRTEHREQPRRGRVAGPDVLDLGHLPAIAGISRDDSAESAPPPRHRHRMPGARSDSKREDEDERTMAGWCVWWGGMQMRWRKPGVSC